MPDQSPLSSSSHQIWIAVTLALLVCVQTCSYLWMARHAVEPGDFSGLMYNVIFIALVIGYLHASGFRLRSSFDYGFIMWILYPILIPYALVKIAGPAKGLFILLLLIAGFIVPFLAYALQLESHLS